MSRENMIGIGTLLQRRGIVIDAFIDQFLTCSILILNKKKFYFSISKFCVERTKNWFVECPLSSLVTY